MWIETECYVMKQYYDLVFRKEEIILRTYLMRVLQGRKREV